MIDLFSLLSIGIAFFVIAVSPGPANISNATIAMSKGRRTSLIYGAGLSTGLVFWGVVAASGMGAILQSSVYLLMALKVFGGLYLLRLAFLSAKESMKPNSTNVGMIEETFSGKKWFLRGVIMNISNPKTVIAWMAALSVGLNSNDGIFSVISGLVVCIIVGFATNGMYSICFSYSRVMNWYQRASRWINGVTSFLFTIAGIGLLRSAFNRSSMS
ncbi:MULTISPECIES: LysE family translocator [Grimontia]|uniref:Threonine efflux protein n=1 Tax=Grimontia marina TaxID=646534 RepID=A0A128EZB1_9GAMM|nr:MULTISPECIES: LysE family translocator [Grimontia]WRV98889.1 LysE family translocator [Grimontia sp. NTOU-MAR1]CZF79605.1 Threonine efflux protein [Grimontia marina]